MKNLNVWQIIEKVLFFLLIIAFLLLSDSKVTKVFCSIVLILNAVYIVVYVIHIRKHKNDD